MFTVLIPRWLVVNDAGVVPTSTYGIAPPTITGTVVISFAIPDCTVTNVEYCSDAELHGLDIIRIDSGIAEFNPAIEFNSLFWQQ